jgi:hypothetical protein
LSRGEFDVVLPTDADDPVTPDSAVGVPGVVDDDVAAVVVVVVVVALAAVVLVGVLIGASSFSLENHDEPFIKLRFDGRLPEESLSLSLSLSRFLDDDFLRRFDGSGSAFGAPSGSAVTVVGSVGAAAVDLSSLVMALADALSDSSSSSTWSCSAVAIARVET